MKLKLGSFSRNLALVMSGTIIAQLINILVAPLLSRLYEPEAFGVFAVYTSILSIVGVIIALRYELAIQIPKSKRSAIHIFILTLLIIFTITLFTLILVALFDNEIASFLGGNEFINMLWWLPISVFTLGLFKTLNQLIIRLKEFKTLTYSQLNRSIFTAIVQIIGGLLIKSPGGLIGGQAIGQAAAVIFMGKKVYKRKTFSILSWKRVFKEFKKHKEFAIFSAPQALLNSLSQNILVILLAFFFTSTIVGFYALSERILKIPLRMIGQSLRQVFFQKASETYNSNKSVNKITKRLTIYLSLIGLIPTAIVIIYGPELFSIILGSKWREAGVYAQILMPAFFMSFINIPAVVIVPVIKLQKFHMNYEIILTTLRVGTILVGGVLQSIILTLSLYSLVSVLMNILLINYIIQHPNSRTNDLKF
ncbi:lipopolysaccharide biosynthesis protein [Halobacillus massiliensis]|uniref:lipopolysaccharide biosynthesis protein n=1 Tax=Halobacillus massiliensis TaxID=1926286 RepID=UPI0009E49069|nr:oligosaccharide flippase family protein [Halobacillus massiliensis]